ncbi:MAG: hypothetical protein HY698_16340 [Deltaproteobacteria bacterium]|nr:hypothetical protein [Deltaproteobacteria bacterium]
MKRRIACTLLVLAWSGCADPATSPPVAEEDNELIIGRAPVIPAPSVSEPKATDLSEDDPCITAAGKKAEAWKTAGVSPAEIETRFQAALARCAGATDAATARFIGALNVDLFRTSQLLIANSISPTKYLLAVQDRGGKARLAQKDSTWAAAYVKGDADGDFVPDARDRCPGTADLTPTDANGCPRRIPQRQRPIAPDPQSVRQILNSFNLVVDPRCKGTPVPPTPRPVKVGYGDMATNIAVTRVKNQPAGCLVLYEIDARFMNPGWESNFERHPEYPHFVLRSTEEVPGGSIPAGVIRFQVRGDDTRDFGNRAIFASLLGQYEEISWRVRAINGNGLRSTFSDWQHLSGSQTGSGSGPFTAP